MTGALVWGSLAVLSGLGFLVVAGFAGAALLDRDGRRERIVSRYPLRSVTALLLLPAAMFSAFGILASTIEGFGDMTGLALAGAAGLAGSVGVQVVAHLAVSRALGGWRWMVAPAGFTVPAIAAVWAVNEPGAMAWLLAYGLACGGNGLVLAWRGGLPN